MAVPSGRCWCLLSLTHVLSLIPPLGLIPRTARELRSRHSIPRDPRATVMGAFTACLWAALLRGEPGVGRHRMCPAGLACCWRGDTLKSACFGVPSPADVHCHNRACNGSLWLCSANSVRAAVRGCCPIMSLSLTGCSRQEQPIQKWGSPILPAPGDGVQRVQS